MTIAKQQITALELMERAALQAFLWLVTHFQDKKTTYHIFCGVGNNGGDGLVIARMLKQNFFDVRVYVVVFSAHKAPNFDENLIRLKETNLTYEVIAENTLFPVIADNHVVIDAIFGIGLTREVPDWIQKLFQKLNEHPCYKVAVDVPSGLFLDKKTSLAVKANVVLTFQWYHPAFFLPDNAGYCQEVVVLPIDLDPETIALFSTDYYYLDWIEIKKRYRPLSRHTHKGKQGHVLLIGGSYGKIGAMVLASQTALRSGCGLVTVYLPKCGYEIMQTATPEAMVITDNQYASLHTIEFALQPNAIGIGMGLGQEATTSSAFKTFLKHNKLPLVLDADALNLLAKHPEWLIWIPKNSILTPHPKELERFIGTWSDDFEKLDKVKKMAQIYQVVVVIKGAFTWIVTSDTYFINASGNQALATAGSGDALSGIITSFCAQGYSSLDAALLGVYFHGRSADLATKAMGFESFIASDISRYLGNVFLEVATEKNNLQKK